MTPNRFYIQYCITTVLVRGLGVLSNNYNFHNNFRESVNLVQFTGTAMELVKLPFWNVNNSKPCKTTVQTNPVKYSSCSH